MILKKIILLSVFISFINSVNAQEKVDPNSNHQSNKSTTTQTVARHKSTPDFQKHWRFGGNVGFNFWNGGTDILLAPKAYYQIAPQFMAGAGLTYIYSKNKNQNFEHNSNSVGGSILGVFRPIPYLQLSAEFEELHTNWKNQFISDSFWNDALYLGVSFVSGNFAFGLQYDVLYDEQTSSHASALTPIISFYF